MLALTAPRVQRAMAPYDRKLGLDGPLCARALDIFARTLEEQPHVTRAELGAALARAGIEARGSRLAHLAMRAELEALIYSGPRHGKQVHVRAAGSARAARARKRSPR